MKCLLISQPTWNHKEQSGVLHMGRSLVECSYYKIQVEFVHFHAKSINDYTGVLSIIFLLINIPPDWLCRSRIKQYRHSYSKLEYLWGYSAATSYMAAIVTKASKLVPGSLFPHWNSVRFFATVSLSDMNSLQEVKFATLYRQSSNTSRIL